MLYTVKNICDYSCNYSVDFNSFFKLWKMLTKRQEHVKCLTSKLYFFYVLGICKNIEQKDMIFENYKVLERLIELKSINILEDFELNVVSDLILEEFKNFLFDVCDKKLALKIINA